MYYKLYLSHNTTAVQLASVLCWSRAFIISHPILMVFMSICHCQCSYKNYETCSFLPLPPITLFEYGNNKIVIHLNLNLKYCVHVLFSKYIWITYLSRHLKKYLNNFTPVLNKNTYIKYLYDIMVIIVYLLINYNVG